MEVVLLVLILLPDLTLLASSANLLLSLVPCIGQWVLRIWVISGFLFLSFLSFSSNGLDIGCSVKRLPDLMLGRTVPFRFPLFLWQRELKFDMVVILSVGGFQLWPSCLVVLVGSYPVGLALIVSVTTPWLESVFVWAYF